MKRAWYVSIRSESPRFAVRVVSVFDYSKPERALELEVPDLEGVAALIRELGPVSSVPPRYMDVEGPGSFLRIATLPEQPLARLLRLGLSELKTAAGSVTLVLPLLTRGEVEQRIAAWKRRPKDS